MHVRRPTAGPRQSQRAFGPPSRPSIGGEISWIADLKRLAAA